MPELRSRGVLGWASWAAILSGAAAALLACSSSSGSTTGSSSGSALTGSAASTGSSAGSTSSSSAAAASSTNGSSPAANSSGAGTSTGGSSTGTGPGTTGGAAPRTYVYVENNDPSDNDTNAILAFQRSGLTLVPLPAGATFALGGAGQGNPGQVLGPDDSDQEIVIDYVNQRLYAVNQGSNTIAGFHIESNGALDALDGSPYPSGGDGPVSLGLAGNLLYVVNQAADKMAAPNYTILTVKVDGSLSPVVGLKPITTPVGAAPSQALVPPGQNHLFSTDFLGPVSSPPVNSVRSFLVTGDGGLSRAPGDPVAVPTSASPGGSAASGLALGLAVHPTMDILYVGFALYSEVGVYTYDDTGALSYVTATPLTGKTICWVRVSSNGLRLYASNTDDDSISVVDLSSPLDPVEIEHFKLADSMGTPFNGTSVTSAAYQQTLSPDETSLFVVSQRVTTNSSDTTSPGNILHILVVDADAGTVSEPGLDIPLDAPSNARAQGVAAIQLP